MTLTEIADKYQLSAERFTWELYDAGWRERFGHWEKPVTPLEIAKVFIGWCDASRLLVRPRCGEYAFMCEIDGESFWFHHVSDMLDGVLGAVKEYEGSK